MISNTEDFCSIISLTISLILSLKFATNLLTPQTFLPYLLAMSLQYIDNIFELIPSFSGANG